jgi:DNA-binding XRE family transcriptional regulator
MLPPALEYALSLMSEPSKPVAASDGTLYRTPHLALLHDLVELKLKRLMPTMQDAATITRTRSELRLSRAELAKCAGVSESLIVKIERGERPCTPECAEKLWVAMCRIHDAGQQAIPKGIELLFRLEEGDTVGVTTVREVLR